MSDAGAPPPVLSLPIDCVPGSSCFVQQYFDHHPGPGAKDYRCGSRVYDGHNGVDIRLPSIAAQRRGVWVLAAAPGAVVGTSDGYQDRPALTAGALRGVKGKECGNGVTIDHGGGWYTRYCHMARESIRVAVGERVGTGQRIGLVGLSGATSFPHLHLSVVRLGKEMVDPFAPDMPAGACGTASGNGLWSAAAAQALAYRETEIIGAGFAGNRFKASDVDGEALTRPHTRSPSLVFFGRAVGLKAGDVVELRMTDPQGRTLAENMVPVNGPKAELFSMIGRNRGPGEWPQGRYRASFVVKRGGQTAVERLSDMTL